MYIYIHICIYTNINLLIYMYICVYIYLGASLVAQCRELLANAGDTGDVGSIPRSGRPPGEGRTTHSSILAEKSHGQRSLAVYNPWGHKKSYVTEHTSIYPSIYICDQNYLRQGSFETFLLNCMLTLFPGKIYVV